jgi:hypothetical protein
MRGGSEGGRESDWTSGRRKSTRKAGTEEKEMTTETVYVVMQSE